MPASLRAVPAIVTRLSSGSVAAQKPAARTTFSRPKRSLIRDNVGVISRCIYTTQYADHTRQNSAWTIFACWACLNCKNDWHQHEVSMRGISYFPKDASGVIFLFIYTESTEKVSQIFWL